MGVVETCNKCGCSVWKPIGNIKEKTQVWECNNCGVAECAFNRDFIYEENNFITIKAKDGYLRPLPHDKNYKLIEEQ